MNVIDFLKVPGVVIDVRSPAEYAHSRIPGATNIPLFSDAERAVVGTTYKQQGRQQAIELGLRLVGPKLADLTVDARRLANGGCAKVHCWRGGMRSGSMAWLLRTAGLQVVTLEGGYKAFRRRALTELKRPLQLHVIGGLTGSGKTRVLHALRTLGEQVLDLEALAHHRGSSYGMLNQPPQPSTEQFENEIAVRWASFDPKRPVWIEDESRMIGMCKIPDALFQQMLYAPLTFLERPLEQRVEILLEEYGVIGSAALIQATMRLQKRLGLERTQSMLALIQARQLPDAIAMALEYYDKTYTYGLSKKKPRPIQKLSCGNLSAQELAVKLCSEF